MSNFTPGPWELIEDRTPGSLEIGENGRAICEIWRRNDPETENANARLIAAAPEMLEALRDCRRALEIANFTQELAVVDAAIAKATGGQP